MYLLDTNVLSELRKVAHGKADPNVASWVENRSIDELYISTITVFEIEKGILKVERKDQQQGSILRGWFVENVLPAFEGRIISLDVEVARISASLHIPDPKAEADSIIAATAIAHGMTLVTRNVNDFRNISVPIFNPWEQS